MEKNNFNTLKVSSDRINLAKIEPTLVKSWLDKNSKVISTKNKHVGISDCPAPWG